MTPYETLSVTLASIAIIVSIGAVIVAGQLNKKIFKRQNIISLHMAWQGANIIDPAKLVPPDVVKVVNCLSLTASLWNHDVVEKIIIFQSYWPAYQTLYDILKSSEVLIPGLNRRFKDLITSEITKAYEDMKEMEINYVKRTKI